MEDKILRFGSEKLDYYPSAPSVISFGRFSRKWMSSCHRNETAFWLLDEITLSFFFLPKFRSEMGR